MSSPVDQLGGRIGGLTLCSGTSAPRQHSGEVDWKRLFPVKRYTLGRTTALYKWISTIFEEVSADRDVLLILDNLDWVYPIVLDEVSSLLSLVAQVRLMGLSTEWSPDDTRKLIDATRQLSSASKEVRKKIEAERKEMKGLLEAMGDEEAEAKRLVFVCSVRVDRAACLTDLAQRHRQLVQEQVASLIALVKSGLHLLGERLENGAPDDGSDTPTPLLAD